MPSIKAILLDLGGVVFELDMHGPLRNLNLPAEVATRVLREWTTNAHYDQFERGKMTFQDFQSVFHEGIFSKLSHEDFNRAWRTIILRPFPEVEKLVEEYKQRIPIYALSNINEPHWKSASTEFTVMSHFERAFTSFEIGLRKPESAIYRHVLDELKLKAPEVLFVDDNQANLDGAKAMGLQTELCANDPKKLRAIFEKYVPR